MALELHFDARDLALSDGETVVSWPDKSGNERDVKQAFLSLRPLLKTGILNGKPVVRFDGENDFLRATGFELAQPNTIFVVGSSTLGPILDGAAEAKRHLLQRNVESKWQLLAGGALASGAIADNDAHLVVAVVEGVNSLIRVDSATVAEGNAGVQALEGVVLGARFDGAANFLNGDIAEVRVYGTALSGPEIAAVEAELTRRWFGGAVASLGGPGQPLSHRNRIVNP